jgi:hypothetical protein
MTLSEEEIIIKSNKFYGFENRKFKTIEECSELIKAIVKLQVFDSESLPLTEFREEQREKLIESICDEISDVEIVINSIKKFLPAGTLNKYKKFKLQRLLERISK